MGLESVCDGFKQEFFPVCWGIKYFGLLMVEYRVGFILFYFIIKNSMLMRRCMLLVYEAMTLGEVDAE